MNNPKVTTSIILEKRHPNKDGLYPTKLRLTFKRKRKYYSIRKIPEINKYNAVDLKKVPLSLSADDFEKITSPRPRGVFKEYKKLFNVIENKTDEICSGISNFSFEKFEIIFFGNEKTTNNVNDLFQSKINELKNNNQIGTSTSYNATLKSIQKYHNKKIFLIQDIDVQFLNNYEKYMIENKNSYTTIGIYLRNLRHIINTAIDKGIFNPRDYPFGKKNDKKKYTIPKSVNIKKALSKEELKRLFEYIPQNSQEQKAKDYWFFSYLCNGMNIIDIAYLTCGNIKKNKIQFYRKKTINTSETKKLISIIITKEVEEIINRVGSTTKENDYIFPILNKNMDLKKQRATISQHIKIINKYIKIIAKKIDIDTSITTYWARHSFATMLKRSGAPISFISEGLGHHGEKITEAYLDSFQDDAKEKYANELINF